MYSSEAICGEECRCEISQDSETLKSTAALLCHIVLTKNPVLFSAEYISYSNPVKFVRGAELGSTGNRGGEGMEGDVWRGRCRGEGTEEVALRRRCRGGSVEEKA